eukprot:scaffold10680_cov118-Isochrysis_galbana.AAC.2
MPSELWSAAAKISSTSVGAHGSPSRHRPRRSSSAEMRHDSGSHSTSSNRESRWVESRVAGPACEWALRGGRGAVACCVSSYPMHARSSREPLMRCRQGGPLQIVFFFVPSLKQQPTRSEPIGEGARAAGLCCYGLRPAWLHAAFNVGHGKEFPLTSRPRRTQRLGGGNGGASAWSSNDEVAVKEHCGEGHASPQGPCQIQRDRLAVTHDATTGAAQWSETAVGVDTRFDESALGQAAAPIPAHRGQKLARLSRQQRQPDCRVMCTRATGGRHHMAARRRERARNQQAEPVPAVAVPGRRRAA